MPPTPDRRRPLPGPVRRPPSQAPLDLPDDDSRVSVSKLGIWFGLVGLGLLLIDRKSVV